MASCRVRLCVDVRLISCATNPACAPRSWGPLVMMRESELERFGAICRRHGLSAEQFQVGVEDYCEFIDGEGVWGEKFSRSTLGLHADGAIRAKT